MTHGELHFSVEGAFIMDLAREAYWFEDRKEWALNVLSHLNGMTVDQALKVLRGEASLSGIDDIEFHETPDAKFQKRLTKHNQWLADKEIKEQKERQDTMDAHEKQWDELDRNEKRIVAIQRASELHDEVMSGRPEKPKEIVVPKNPVKLGKFIVEKELLDNYLKVASDHDLMDPWDAGTALLLSGRMMRIHLLLRESVGLEGYWGRDEKRPYDPDAFDKALQAVVHKNNEKDERYKLRQKQIRSKSYGATAETIEAAGAAEESYKRLHPDDEEGEPIEPLVKGLPASQGRATGPVRLAMTEAALKDVKKGDVLVTSFISPDTIFAIDKVAAIVTDVGGLTSHAAIVSREFGVPCIVGAGNATKVLKDGDIVTVDGSTGLVFPKLGKG